MRGRAAPAGLIAAGLVACAAELLAALRWPHEALTGWLAAACAAASLPAGALLLLLMMRLIPGAWGEVLRLACEAAALLTPLAVLAFVPVTLALGQVYPWVGRPPNSAFAAQWLTPAGYVVRTVLWLTLVAGCGWAMLGRRRSGVVAAVGLVLLAPMTHLVAVDWLMSRDPDFASSAFGLQVLSIMATIAFCAVLLLRHAVGARALRTGVLGALLLTLLLIWAYLDFMAYLIVWSGNLPANVGWYVMRGGLWAKAMLLAAVLGGASLLLLLLAPVRRNPRWLGGLAAAVLAGKLIELAWLAVPPLGAAAALLAALALAGMSSLMAGLLPLALARRVRSRSA